MRGDVFATGWSSISRGYASALVQPRRGSSRGDSNDWSSQSALKGTAPAQSPRRSSLLGRHVRKDRSLSTDTLLASTAVLVPTLPLAACLALSSQPLGLRCGPHRNSAATPNPKDGLAPFPTGSCCRSPEVRPNGARAAFQSRYIRDVRHPQPIRLRGAETALHTVRCHGRGSVPARRVATLPALPPQNPKACISQATAGRDTRSPAASRSACTCRVS